ncbi:MAG: YggS family pyridoxal phosphate-dependent enzyme [Solirubrobacteraceae bacterium]
MASVISPLHAESIRAQVALAREHIAAAAKRAGRAGDAVELLVATKYVALADLPILAQAGVKLLGENRAQDLEAKATAHGDLFTWDFIGQLQSRKVRTIVPHVRLIHSLASMSAMRELERHLDAAKPGLQALIEVNVAGEQDKAGVAPHELDLYLERCPVPVAGLMGMPPAAEHPSQSRRWFSALRELAHERGLRELSMGTSQDFEVAVEEGATIVRLGTSVLSTGMALQLGSA